MVMGTVGILISLVYVLFGVLLFAILCTGLVVLLRVNALLKRRAAPSSVQAQSSSVQTPPSPQQAQPSPEPSQSQVAEPVLPTPTDR